INLETSACFQKQQSNLTLPTACFISQVSEMPHTFPKTLNVSHILKKILECITGQYCASCLNMVLQLFHFIYITSQYCAFASTWFSSYITIICYLSFSISS